VVARNRNMAETRCSI